MTKIILAIAAAFVVGTMTTGIMASALPPGDPFLELQQQVTDIINGNIPVGSVDWGSISGKPAGFADGVDDVNDADSSTTNELQDWSNLPGIPSGFADGVDDVNDADSSTTNELQELVVTYRAGDPKTIAGGGFTGQAWATCNADEKILGGGFTSNCGVLYPIDAKFAPQGTFPPSVLNSDAWLMNFKNNCPVDVSVTVTATCGKLSP